MLIRRVSFADNDAPARNKFTAPKLERGGSDYRWLHLRLQICESPASPQRIPRRIRHATTRTWIDHEP